MKQLSMHALLFATYTLVLGVYAWLEHEPLMVVLGILPVLLFLVVKVLNEWFEKKDWSWTTTR
jgi:hypothetical protein